MLKVNLQPKITLEAKEGFRMPLWPAILLLILVASAVGGSYWMSQQEILQKDAEIKQYDFRLRDFQQTIADYDTAQNEKSYLQGKRDFVESISGNQRQWIDFFDQMRSNTPKDVWFTRFSGNRTGTWDIEGSTFTYASVGFLMLQLNMISHIDTVVLNTTSGSTGGGGKKVESGKDIRDQITKKFKMNGAMTLKSPEPEKPKGAPGAPAAPAN